MFVNQNTLFALLRPIATGPLLAIKRTATTQEVDMNYLDIYDFKKLKKKSLTQAVLIPVTVIRPSGAGIMPWQQASVKVM